MKIHSTAIVDEKAILSKDVVVGPYTIIHAEVYIDKGSVIGPNSVIYGKTTIGQNNRLHSHCVIGDAPQDQKYKGEPSELIIGNDNTIREFTTIHRGAQTTKIGDNNLLMAYSHVAHDCTVGDNNILSNGATLGGHVELGNKVVLGGLCAIHQHCRIGTLHGRWKRRPVVLGRLGFVANIEVSL